MYHFCQGSWRATHKPGPFPSVSNRTKLFHAKHFGDIILDITNTAGGSQDIEKSRAATSFAPRTKETKDQVNNYEYNDGRCYRVRISENTFNHAL
jgi:hypothetical protein